MLFAERRVTAAVLLGRRDEQFAQLVLVSADQKKGKQARQLFSSFSSFPANCDCSQC